MLPSWMLQPNRPSPSVLFDLLRDSGLLDDLVKPDYIIIPPFSLTTQVGSSSMKFFLIMFAFILTNIVCCTFHPFTRFPHFTIQLKNSFSDDSSRDSTEFLHHFPRQLALCKFHRLEHMAHCSTVTVQTVNVYFDRRLPFFRYLNRKIVISS